MDGRMGGWDGFLKGWMEGRIDGRIDGWMDGCMDGRMDEFEGHTCLLPHTKLSFKWNIN